MNELYFISSKFDLEGTIINVNKHGKGLINKTYYVETTKKKYILQNINKYVFKNVNLLMENIYLVTKYIKKKRGNTLDIVKTKDNNLLFDFRGDYYRCYVMKDESKSYETLPSDSLALVVGKVIGKFQENLIDLDVNKINSTINFFHDLRHRYIDLVKAYRKCENKERLEETKELVTKIISEYDKIMVLPNLFRKGIIRKRICHYDTKLNNFLFSSNNDNCLIDLDTVMPGCLIYDFGDCARNIIVNIKEDDFDKDVNINISRLIYLTTGYLSVGKNYLTKTEIDNLFNSIKVITLELSIRFLTDYLDGDLYFSISYDQQNLARSKCQFNIYNNLLKEETRIKSLINLVYERLTNIN